MLPAEFSDDAVALIRERLDDARGQGATILFAIESGSRAWGFPSPDSDYDCRFIYGRGVADHLRLDPPRDVIEFPLVGEIDASGWDLRKALHLALAGNAVVVEWAKAPIAYEEIPGFRQRFVALLDRIVDPVKVARHYLGLARSHVDRMGSFAEPVKLKKLFYLLRPVVALDWMEQRSFAALPPMSLPECLETSDLPADAAADIARMIAEKAITREMGEGPVPPALARYLYDRYAHHRQMDAARGSERAASPERRALAAAFYKAEIERIG